MSTFDISESCQAETRCDAASERVRGESSTLAGYSAELQPGYEDDTQDLAQSQYGEEDTTTTEIKNIALHEALKILKLVDHLLDVDKDGPPTC